MHVVVLGLNHASASVEQREPFAYGDEALGPALDALRREVDEGFILSTCNRIELYAVTTDTESPELTVRRLRRFLARRNGDAYEAAETHWYAHTQDAAVRHLFDVAAGLDSMVLGEDQILAQVKSALDAATTAGALGPVLHRLGAWSLSVGKRVRRNTTINRAAVSVVSVALEAAREHLGDLHARRALVVGAGRAAGTTLKHLSRARAEITVVNRTVERAAELASRHGAQVRPWAELDEAIAGAELLVSTTAAPTAVIDAARMRRARVDGRPLVCLDLAVPRDVDPQAAAVPGVTIYDVDALQPLAARNRSRREAAVSLADGIVADETERFMAWWRGRRVAPAIHRLRTRAEAIRDAELERALARMPELDPREQIIVRGLANRLVNKLLHQPVTSLKDDPAGADLVPMLDRLFPSS